MADAKLVRPGRAGVQREGRLAREIIETVVLTLLIFFAVHFSVQPFRVDGPSMQPGLHTDELVLVNLLTYDFSAPQRGDVIVFHPPTSVDAVTDGSVQYVKRIIGVPGDTVTITATAVYVDGKKLNEPYIYPLERGASENPVTLRAVLGKDEYFVMGDNRLNSSDSRYFGSITKRSIIGKAEVVMWPLNSFTWLPNYSNVFAGAQPGGK
ncbi:MAG: signal peptidase I [Ktedonobacterales bacterium]